MSRASSAKPYFWDIGTMVKINKYFDGYFYSPDQSDRTYKANYPVARYSSLIGPSPGGYPEQINNDDNGSGSGRKDY